jgi:hypothetical protein
MTQNHLSRSFLFPHPSDHSFFARSASHGPSGSRENILRISARAIIYDHRLAPAGQTSGVATETKENEKKDDPAVEQRTT